MRPEVGFILPCQLTVSTVWSTVETTIRQNSFRMFNLSSDSVPLARFDSLDHNLLRQEELHAEK